MTDCMKIKKLMVDKFAGNINAADLKMFEEHLSKCVECSREYGELLKLASAVAEMKLKAPEKLSAEARKSILGTKPHSKGMNYTAVAAVVVISFAVLSGMLLPALNSDCLRTRIAGVASSLGSSDFTSAVSGNSIDVLKTMDKDGISTSSNYKNIRGDGATPSNNTAGATSSNPSSAVPSKAKTVAYSVSAEKKEAAASEHVAEEMKASAVRISVSSVVVAEESVGKSIAMPDSTQTVIHSGALKLAGVVSAADRALAKKSNVGKSIAMPDSLSINNSELKVTQRRRAVADAGAVDNRKLADTKAKDESNKIDISLDIDSDSAELKPAKPITAENRLKGRFEGPAPRRDDFVKMNKSFENAFSTFSISTDNASYIQARKLIMSGRIPPPEIIRPEDFINNFDYRYPVPQAGETFSCTMDSFSNVFRPQSKTLVVGLQGRTLGPGENEKYNYTVLLDSSGSMAVNDRMFSAVRAVGLLADKLRPGDKMNVIAGGRRLGSGSPAQIKNALKTVHPGGVEFFADNLLNAYKDAETNFVSDARNRLVVITDSCRNLSPELQKNLLGKAKYYRSRDIANFVLGVGIEGDDSFLERLAAEGDGAFVGVDSADELETLFSEHFEARFREIAREVKIQVEFNPQVVESWRQVGYVKRQMAAQDFRNDNVNANAVGSGQRVTAVYEITLRPDVASEDIWAARTRFRYQMPGHPGREEREYSLSAAELKKEWKNGNPGAQLAALAGEFAESLAHPDNNFFPPSRVILEHLTRLRQTRMQDDRQVIELEEMIRRSK